MKRLVPWTSVALAAACLALAATPSNAATLSSAPFGTARDGKPVTLYTLRSSKGLVVKFMSYGGVITEIDAPDRHGRMADVVLGFDTLEEYETKSAEGGLFFGALIGRYANRIAKGHFTLDGKGYDIPLSNPPNALHGGTVGFDKKVWDVTPGPASGHSVSAQLHLTSPDGDQGFPGTLKVTVTYTLGDDNAFSIRYQATTDKPTVLNLTNHSYFNLAGAGSPDGVFAQTLMVDADRYTPTDKTAIPLGHNDPVDGTPFDFRNATPIGARIRANDQQLIWAQGYDHNWVLNKHGRSGPVLAARETDPGSGRVLECLTTQPGVQIYTANFLKGAYAGHGGIYRQTDGVTFETQHFPDSPNQPAFPTTVLRPGQQFDETTIFRFSTTK